MRADGTRYFGAFVNNKKTGTGIEYKNKKWLVRIKDPRGDYFSIDESISTTLELIGTLAQYYSVAGGVVRDGFPYFPAPKLY